MSCRNLELLYNNQPGLPLCATRTQSVVLIYCGQFNATLGGVPSMVVSTWRMIRSAVFVLGAYIKVELAQIGYSYRGILNPLADPQYSCVCSNNEASTTAHVHHVRSSGRRRSPGMYARHTGCPSWCSSDCRGSGQNRVYQARLRDQ